MEQQLDIPFEPKKLARSSDPSTSKAAAKQAGELRAQHHLKILAALQLIREGTTYDISEPIHGMDNHAVTRRMKELEKARKVYTTGERIGPTGRKCRVWKAV